MTKREASEMERENRGKHSHKTTQQRERVSEGGKQRTS
jgi:hypothetical protein